LRIWRRERCGRTLLGSTNSPGANLDSRRLAPQREARRGWAHGWAQQSPRTSRNSAVHRSGVFRIWRRYSVDEPSKPDIRTSPSKLAASPLFAPASSIQHPASATDKLPGQNGNRRPAPKHTAHSVQPNRSEQSPRFHVPWPTMALRWQCCRAEAVVGSGRAGPSSTLQVLL
jgi:hypothetical protein